MPFDILKPEQNGCLFADDIFKCIFLNENVQISHEISVKYVPGGLMDAKSALFQVMAWHRTGDNPLPESTRYVEGTPTSEVTPVTIRYIRPPHQGHTSQYHGHEWMTHILFVHYQSAAPFLR